MTKYIRCFFLIVLALTLSSCYYIYQSFREIRFRLNGTNIIGIVGAPSEEPYIEIQYSVADWENPGVNKTASILVSPPYIFQNDDLYITYEYVEESDNTSGLLRYIETLLSDYNEGGAEYLRIINHSPDKPVEFFIAGAQMPERSGADSLLPSVRYKNVPVYFLLYPDEREKHPAVLSDVPPPSEVEGDLILTEAWTLDEVIALYRAEHNRSDEIILKFEYYYRIIDVIEGLIPGWESYKGKICYGIIGAGEELRGDEKIWLIATPTRMFYPIIREVSLR